MRRRRIRRKRALALALLPATMISAGWAVPTSIGQEVSQKATARAESTVRFGDAATIRGEFPDSGDAEVAILHRAARDDGFRRVGTAHTNARGGWSARIKPRRSGDWRAEIAAAPAPDPLATAPARDTESNTERIRVRSATKVVPTKRDVVAGQAVVLRGRVLPAGQRDVIVELGNRDRRVRTDKEGRYEVKLDAPAAGEYRVRATAKDNRDAGGSKDSGGKVTTYRYALASWYGPGLYGNRTACGQTLTSSTRGVAHKSLPCGTRVKIRHGSRSVTVPVIDRGPYVGDREFDLTYATRNDLGFGSTGRILVSH